MQDHRDALGLDRRPERTESGLVEVVAVDRSPDLQTPEPEVVDDTVHLGNGQVGVLQWDRRSQRDEAIGMLGYRRRQIVVLDPGRLGSGPGGSPVEILGNEGSQALQLHTHTIHRF